MINNLKELGGREQSGQNLLLPVACSPASRSFIRATSPWSTVPQWMKERGIFVVLIYSYYVGNYDDCGTAVAAFENAY